MISAADEYECNTANGARMADTRVGDSFLGAAIGMFSVQPEAAPQIGPTLGLANAGQTMGFDITRTPRPPSKGFGS